MTPSNESALLLIQNSTKALDQYVSIIILIFGVIGDVLNILVLSHRSLRSNSCALFFNASSIAGLVAIITGVPTRIMAGWFEDPSATIGWFCKIRTFILYVSRMNFLWCMLFATIDRWLSSCSKVHRRRMSSLKNAQRIIIFIFCLSICLSLFLLYCYDANQTGGPSPCHGHTPICRLNLDIIYSTMITLSPLGLMILFGLLVVYNLHVKRNRIQNISIANTNSNTRTDRQILCMLLGQVITLFLLTTPHAVQKLYTTVTYNTSKSSFQEAIDKLFYSFVITLTLPANGMPFYIYTLTGGHIFRKTLIDLSQKIWLNIKFI